MDFARLGRKSIQVDLLLQLCFQQVTVASKKKKIVIMSAKFLRPTRKEQSKVQVTQLQPIEVAIPMSDSCIR